MMASALPLLVPHGDAPCTRPCGRACHWMDIRHVRDRLLILIDTPLRGPVFAGRGLPSTAPWACSLGRCFAAIRSDQREAADTNDSAQNDSIAR